VIGNSTQRTARSPHAGRIKRRREKSDISQGGKVAQVTGARLSIAIGPSCWGPVDQFIYLLLSTGDISDLVGANSRSAEPVVVLVRADCHSKIKYQSVK
jgi:hypothetical protein